MLVGPRDSAPCSSALATLKRAPLRGLLCWQDTLLPHVLVAAMRRLELDSLESWGSSLVEAGLVPSPSHPREGPQHMGPRALLFPSSSFVSRALLVILWS